MLNEIIPSRPFSTGCRHELAHRVELVVTRENHRLLRHPAMTASAIVHLFLFLFDKHEVAENIEEAVKPEHLLPEIARAIAGLVLGIACPANDLSRMTAAIEWQEECLLPCQPRRHVDLVRIGRE